MKRLLISLLLLATPASSFAGSLSFQVTDATDGTVTKTYSQFTDAHITRWIAANQNACNVAKNGTCTRVQVLNYIVSKFVEDQTALVKQVETNTAKASAEAGVSSISILP